MRLRYDKGIHVQVVIVFGIRNGALENLLHITRDALARKGKISQRHGRLFAADELRHEVQLARADTDHPLHRAHLVVGESALALGLGHTYLLFAFLSAAWP